MSLQGLNKLIFGLFVLFFKHWEYYYKIQCSNLMVVILKHNLLCHFAESPIQFHLDISSLSIKEGYCFSCILKQKERNNTQWSKSALSGCVIKGYLHTHRGTQRDNVGGPRSSKAFQPAPSHQPIKDPSPQTMNNTKAGGNQN